MRSQLAVCLAALAARCIAAPGQIAGRGTTFSVQQMSAGPLPPLPLVLKAMYTKYNGTVSADLEVAAAAASAAAAVQSGSVIATPRPDDNEYYSPVTVGASHMNVLLDTGSSDLYVTQLFLSVPLGYAYGAQSSTSSTRLPPLLSSPP